MSARPPIPSGASGGGLARISQTVPGAARPFVNRETRQRLQGILRSQKSVCTRDIGRRKFLKYSEYCIFALELPILLGNIASYFNRLDPEFVTPGINEIFQRINELKPP